MSMQAIRWARLCRGLTSTQKLVLMMLADSANAEGICWNAASSLAEETGLSDRAVRTALHDLIEGGAIAGEMRSGVRPLWQLAVQETGTTFLPKRNGLPLSKRNHIPTNRNQLPVSNRNHVPTNRNQLPSKAEPRSDKPEPGSDEPSITHLEPSRTQTLVLAPLPSACGFESWWAAYPRKIGKDAARTAYVAAIKRGASDAILLEAIRRHRWPDEMRFIPHARTWLTQGRWQDDPRHAAPSAPKREALHETIADMMRDPMRPVGTPSTTFDFEGEADHA